MKATAVLMVAALSAVLLASGCEKKSPVDKAVDTTKDALNVRDHEKLKDAAEDAKSAVDNAAEGVKDAAKGE
jgi:hypothetical protein